MSFATFVCIVQFINPSKANMYICPQLTFIGLTLTHFVTLKFCLSSAYKKKILRSIVIFLWNNESQQGGCSALLGCHNQKENQGKHWCRCTLKSCFTMTHSFSLEYYLKTQNQNKWPSWHALKHVFSEFSLKITNWSNGTQFHSSYPGKLPSTFPLKRIVNETTLYKYWLQAHALLFKEYAAQITELFKTKILKSELSPVMIMNWCKCLWISWILQQGSSRGILERIKHTSLYHSRLLLLSHPSSLLWPTISSQISLFILIYIHNFSTFY